MKKVVSWLLTVLLLMMTVSGCAEVTAADYCIAAEALLFETENVTLSALAEFELDGHITGFDGKITVSVELTNGEKHDLTVTAEGAARDYGASHVDLAEYVIGVQTEGDCPCD